MTALLIIVTFDSCYPQTLCYLSQNDGGFPQRKLGQKKDKSNVINAFFIMFNYLQITGSNLRIIH